MVVNTVRSRWRRLLAPLERAYVRWRLHGAEADLEHFRRELNNRFDQMCAHRRACEQLRVRLALLQNG